MFLIHRNSLSSLLCESELAAKAEDYVLMAILRRYVGVADLPRHENLSKIDAARFSFLLGTPAMGGAFLLEARNIVEYILDPVFYVGILTSFIVGILAMRFLFKFLQKFGFVSFAIYRTVIAVIIIMI